MATQNTATANQKIRSQRISSIVGAVITLLGLAGLAGNLNQAACGFSVFLGMSLRVAFEAVPSILLVAWHLVEACALGHLVHLGSLPQISVSWWQVVGTLAGAA